MAIIWQSTWFWLMLSTVLLLILGSIAIKLNKSDIQVNSGQTMTATAPSYVQYDTNPLYLQTSYDTSALYDDIVITRPDCYDLTRNTYSCLGQIQNNSEHLIGDIAINMQFFDPTGENLLEETFAIEQRLIPSQSWAPYRVIFNMPNEQILDDNFIMNSMINSLLPPATHLEVLTVHQEDLFIAQNRYHISVSIENDTPYLAENIRLFTSLSTTEWGLVGYDIHEVVESVESGLSLSVNIEVIPHILASEVDIIFHAEALLIDD